MVWYEEYDFISNPFTIKPQEGYDDFFGQKEIIKKLNKNIRKGTMNVVYGKYGTGKTTVMKGIIDMYKGKRKVAYYNCYTSERKINFNDILVKGGNRLSGFFGIKSKDMILLIDEAHNLMSRDFKNLEELYNEGYFKSVVLVTSKSDYKFPQEIDSIVDGNKYELKMFSEAEAISLIKSRLEGVELLDDAAIKKILNMSSTPREFMSKCDEACRRAVERGSEKVEEEDIKNL